MISLNPAVDPDLVEFLYGLPRLSSTSVAGERVAWQSARRRIGQRAAGLPASRTWMVSSLISCAPRHPARLRLGGVHRLSELGILDERGFEGALNGARARKGTQLLPGLADACVRSVATLAWEKEDSMTGEEQDGGHFRQGSGAPLGADVPDEGRRLRRRTPGQHGHQGRRRHQEDVVGAVREGQSELAFSALTASFAEALFSTAEPC